MEILYTEKLELKGILYSSNVSEIQNRIEYALEKRNSLTINISGITSIDISGIFMLYLIYTKAKEVNKLVHFSGMENDNIQRAMWMAGIKIPTEPIAA